MNFLNLLNIKFITSKRKANWSPDMGTLYKGRLTGRRSQGRPRWVRWRSRASRDPRRWPRASKMRRRTLRRLPAFRNRRRRSGKVSDFFRQTSQRGKTWSWWWSSGWTSRLMAEWSRVLFQLLHNFFHDNFPIIKLVGVSALRKEKKNGNTWSDIRLK